MRGAHVPSRQQPRFPRLLLSPCAAVLPPLRARPQPSTSEPTAQTMSQSLYESRHSPPGRLFQRLADPRATPSPVAVPSSSRARHASQWCAPRLQSFVADQTAHAPGRCARRFLLSDPRPPQDSARSAIATCKRFADAAERVLRRRPAFLAETLPGRISLRPASAFPLLFLYTRTWSERLHPFACLPR